MSQVANGKAYEYALALALNSRTGTDILDRNPAWNNAKGYYEGIAEDLQQNIDISASHVARFLASKESRLDNAERIVIQDDSAGRKGDVRDLVITCKGGDLGISAKHKHDSVKHSRLSDKIDFGKEWGGHPVSAKYWQRVNPVFESMRKAEQAGMMFSEVENKAQTYYLPILAAFEDELRKLCEERSSDFIGRFFRYIVGDHDFYKAICQKEQSVVMSYNLGGTLGWGSKWKVPERIDLIQRKRETDSTLLVTFEGGWQMSFRLHNARSLVEPSLKFDIQFIAMASSVTRNDIWHSA